MTLPALLLDTLAATPPRIRGEGIRLDNVPALPAEVRRVCPRPFAMMFAKEVCTDWPARRCPRRHVAHNRNFYQDLDRPGQVQMVAEGWWSESRPEPTGPLPPEEYQTYEEQANGTQRRLPSFDRMRSDG